MLGNLVVSYFNEAPRSSSKQKGETMTWFDHINVAGLEILLVGIGLFGWSLFRKAPSIPGLVLLMTGFLLQMITVAFD